MTDDFADAFAAGLDKGILLTTEVDKRNKFYMHDADERSCFNHHLSPRYPELIVFLMPHLR